MPSNLITRILARESITQKKLALQIGVSAAQISQWKKGEPIPHLRSAQFYELFPWTEDHLDALCGDGDVADSWKKQLDTSAEGLTFDPAFEPDWHLRLIAETLSDLGMDFTTPAPEVAKSISKRFAQNSSSSGEYEDEDEEFGLSLEGIISDAIRNSCYAAEYAQFSAGYEDHEDLLDVAVALESVARDYAAGRWLSEEARQALNLDEAQWSDWCGKTRLLLLDAIRDYLRERSALGLNIKRDPFPLESSEPDDLIDDIQDVAWEEKLSITGHFSLAEKQILNRLSNIEECFVNLVHLLETRTELKFSSPDKQYPIAKEA